MKRMLCLIMSALCALAAWPVSAQLADATPEAVRAAYESAGLTISYQTVSADGVATFAVEAAGKIVLRAYVYPTAGAALAAHHQAHLQEEGTRNVMLAFSDEAGPQLLSGYSLSLWRQNVALVQVAPTDDVGAYPLEVDCAPGDLAPTRPLPRTLVARQYAAPLETLLGMGATPAQ
ncbi:MAG TPA: hypothetical protein VGL99_32390 [Chloroflexota bacterium]|jgi:hypothetical protein